MGKIPFLKKQQMMSDNPAISIKKQGKKHSQIQVWICALVPDG